MKIFSTSEEWVEIMAESHEHPVVIFKHSSTCPISASAEQKIAKAEPEISAPIYKMIVQDGPELKMQIAEETNVHHESPQVILIKNGEVAYQASHYTIDPENLKSNLS